MIEYGVPLWQVCGTGRTGILPVRLVHIEH